MRCLTYVMLNLRRNEAMWFRSKAAPQSCVCVVDGSSSTHPEIRWLNGYNCSYDSYSVGRHNCYVTST